MTAFYDENFNIKILFANHCEFKVAKRTCILFNQKILEIDPFFKSVDVYNIKNERHNKILINLYYELGNNFSANKNFPIKIQSILKKYRNYYIVNIRNANEYIDIDYQFYTIDIAKSIIKNKFTTDKEKLIELDIILNE